MLNIPKMVAAHLDLRVNLDPVDLYDLSTDEERCKYIKFIVDSNLQHGSSKLIADLIEQMRELFPVPAGIV